MIDHISLRVSNAKKSTAFYLAALTPLGYVRTYEDADDASAFTIPNSKSVAGTLWIVPASESDPISTNVHIAFHVNDTATVKKFYEAALAAGGRDNGTPGKCPEYGDDYYGGFVLDPDGNNVEVVVRVK